MAMSRLHERYRSQVLPALKKEFGYTSDMQVPRLRRIVINMGLGEAIENIKIIQFLFDRQWQELKQYAGENQVYLFGDMPIYIALDSADAYFDGRGGGRLSDHGDLGLRA